ncbi:MAG: septal ring lytic transglycosylase RlpA family protein [Chitinophagaceae bacterium]|nr:septal ring lytic transglycosylase RlpA family protein [Chitinophagaceae bacterium]
MQKVTSLITAFIFCFFINALPAQDTSIIKSKPPKSPKNIIIKYGIASFYAKKFNGRKTSNGDIFSSGKLTAACNVLPLGTWIKVTNIRNDRSVILQVNDHLHPKNKRLVDVSKLAAQQLGFVAYGTTKVKVEVLGRLRNR